MALNIISNYSANVAHRNLVTNDAADADRHRAALPLLRPPRLRPPRGSAQRRDQQHRHRHQPAGKRQRAHPRNARDIHAGMHNTRPEEQLDGQSRAAVRLVVAGLVAAKSVRGRRN